MFARVHVIGAGVMGGDIAAWCALRGMGVTLQDLDMERIKPALDRAKTLFKKRLQQEAPRSTTAVARLEADPERQGRRARRCDHRGGGREARDQAARSSARPKTSSSRARSSPPIPRRSSSSALPKSSSDPARLIGLHFFNPVAQLPLVEVIRSTLQYRCRHRHGRELCARHRQVAGGGEVGAGLPRQPGADALHAGRGAAGRSAARARNCSTPRRSPSACRWGRSS